MVEQWPSAFMDSTYEQSLDIGFSQGRGLIQITNDLSAQPPQIIHVPVNRLA